MDRIIRSRLGRGGEGCLHRGAQQAIDAVRRQLGFRDVTFSRQAQEFHQAEERELIERVGIGGRVERGERVELCCKFKSDRGLFAVILDLKFDSLAGTRGSVNLR